MRRRKLLRLLGGLGYSAAVGSLLPGCGKPARPRVLVVGGGFGGATAAKYLRRVAPGVDVTLIEANADYLCCPTSNYVLAGLRDFDSLRQNYDELRTRHSVEIIHDRAEHLDAGTRTVRLGSGRTLRYERLILAPGIAFEWDRIEAYDEAASRVMPHAWKAGEQTRILRRQIEQMPNGGLVAIAVPPAPFRCPPGPYERASLIAYYLKRHKPRSKILILDANEHFSKQELFLQGWERLYPGMIERIGLSADGAVVRVEPKRMSLFTELDEYRVDVANVIPPQSAAPIAAAAGVADQTGWCPVDPASFESERVPGVHVIGDASNAAPMPKSASAANSQAKHCALAVAAAIAGEAPPPASLHNTCYSLLDRDWGISVSMIYHVSEGRIAPVAGAGGTSPLDASARFRALEADYAEGWYESITYDSFR